MATTTPNFGWAVPTSTDLVKDGAVAIETLGDSIDASLVDLKGGTTGQVLSKASNTDMDFTWVTDAAGDITGVTAGTGISGGGTSGTVTVTNSMATAIDAKGDLIGGTGADTFARLAVGANGTILTADSAQATGLKWATAASGSPMTLIQRSSFSNVADTSTTFDGVFTSTYKSYQIVIESFYAATGTDDLNFQWRIAGVTEAAAYYGNTIQYVFSTNVITNTALSATSLVFLNTACGTSANPSAGTLSVYGCSGSSNTSQIIASYTASDTANSANTYYINTSAAIRTGFILKSSSSNISGTVAVYGLA
jgi:hypothetical protein